MRSIFRLGFFRDTSDPGEVMKMCMNCFFDGHSNLVDKTRKDELVGMEITDLSWFCVSSIPSMKL